MKLFRRSDQASPVVVVYPGHEQLLELVAFLRARLAEEDAAAIGRVTDELQLLWLSHIEARRMTIGWCEEILRRTEPKTTAQILFTMQADADVTLRQIGFAYHLARHPDYRQEWRP